MAREWWTLDELDATHEAVWLSGLGSLVRELLEAGPPAAPLEIGA